MEKYATNLEVIVSDRTQQLAEEKAKTDELLHKMLPKYVGGSITCPNVLCYNSITP